MLLTVIFVLAIICWAALIIALAIQNANSQKKVSALEKEIEIQSSKIDYQKKQLADSINHFSSAEMIIMELIH